MPADLAGFFEQFSPDDRVLVLLRPDPDAIACAMGVEFLLRKRVRSVTIARIGTITRLDNRAMLRVLKVRLHNYFKVDPAAYDRLVMVDSQPSHFAPDVKLPPLAAVIDHHPIGASLSAVAWHDVRPECGACATMLEEYLRLTGRKAPPRLATALCFAIKSDTGNFRRGVSHDDAVAFSRLFPRARYDWMREIERWEFPRSSLPYVRKAFTNLRLVRSTLFAYLGRVNDPDILVIVADFLTHVGGVSMCVIAAVQDDTLSVVFRSDGIRRSARTLAVEAFGAIGSAGGHRSMARAEIPLAALKGNLAGLADGSLESFVVERISRRAVPNRPEKKA